MEDAGNHVPMLFTERRLIDNTWNAPDGWVQYIRGKYLLLLPEGNSHLLQSYETSFTHNRAYRRLGQSRTLQPSVYLMRSKLPVEDGLFDRLYLSNATELLLVFTDI